MKRFIKDNCFKIIIAICILIAVVSWTILEQEENESTGLQNQSTLFYDDGFYINFPQDPEIMELGTTETAKVKTYYSPDNDQNIDYFVKVGKYDDDFMNSIKSRPAFLEGFLSKFPQNLFVPADKNSAVIFSKRLVFFNKYQGIEYKYKSEIDGNRVYHRGIFFMTDDRSFQVSMNYPEILDTKIDDKYNSFVKSLKLKL